MRKLLANQKELHDFMKQIKSIEKGKTSKGTIKRQMVEADRISDANLRAEIRRASENK
jgi:hypothetical protein